MSSGAGYDTIIIGGGFFGCCLAVHLQQAEGRRVVVLEREGDILRRASYANQARIHNGYHYPRSLLTALRCRMNFPRFVKEFPDCVISDFEKYYAVGRLFSKVTAEQYRNFCERIGAPIARAPQRVRRWFDPRLVEDVFVVKEYAFDAVKLKETVRERLTAAGVEVRYHIEAQTVRQAAGGQLEVSCTGPGGDESLRETQPSVRAADEHETGQHDGLAGQTVIRGMSRSHPADVQELLRDSPRRPRPGRDEGRRTKQDEAPGRGLSPGGPGARGGRVVEGEHWRGDAQHRSSSRALHGPSTHKDRSCPTRGGHSCVQMRGAGERPQRWPALPPPALMTPFGLPARG